MKCIKCGTENTSNAKYCIKCGGLMVNRAVNRNVQQTRSSMHPENMVHKNNDVVKEPMISNYNPVWDYNPLGMWAYFGYSILFAIPLLGAILVIVFSVGGTKNINLRNFARSKLCIFIIAAMIAVSFLITTGIYRMWYI